MAYLANTLQPINKPTDTNHNPAQIEFMDKAIVMVGQKKFPLTNRTPYESVAKRGTPTPEHMEETLPTSSSAAEDTAQSYAATVTVTAGIRPVRRKVTMEARHRAVSVGFEENATAQYGIKNSLAHQTMHIGVALNAGWEHTMCSGNQGTQIPDTANDVTGKTATLRSIIETNTKKAAAATNGGWSAANENYAARTNVPTQDSGRTTLTFDDIVSLHHATVQQYSDPSAQNTCWMPLEFKNKIAGESQNGIYNLDASRSASAPGVISKNVDALITASGAMLNLEWAPFMENTHDVLFYNPQRGRFKGLFRNLTFMLGRTGLRDIPVIATTMGFCLPQEKGAAALYDRKTAA